MRQLGDRRLLLDDIRRRDRDSPNSSTESLMNQISTLEAALTPGNSRVSRAADLAHAEASQRSRLESGRAHLRDALSYERRYQRVRAPQDSTAQEPVTTRSSPLSVRATETEPTRSFQQLHEGSSLPTPPHMSGDASDESPPHENVVPLGTASLTPRFAPAHRYFPGIAGDNSSMLEQSAAAPTERTLHTENSSSSRDIPDFIEVLPNIDRTRSHELTDMSYDSLNAEADYVQHMALLQDLPYSRDPAPPSGPLDRAELRVLRQINRRRAAESYLFGRHRSQSDNLDGLGDRQRSFSPDDDAWETMLSTIPPDDQMPSAHSSFTSVTPSASSLSLNSASSYRTLVTAPSTVPEIEACPAEISESDEDSVFEGTDEMELRERHRDPTRFLARSEEHLSRIESLSQRLSRQRTRNEQRLHRRHNFEREEEIRRLESSVQRLERQTPNENFHIAERDRPTSRRERL